MKIKYWVLILGLLCAVNVAAESLTVLGSGGEKYYVYDALGRDYVNSKNTNEFIELAAGDYQVKFNSVFLPVTLAAGQTLQIATGQVAVNGEGFEHYYVYDEFNRTLYTNAYTHESVRLLTGTYTIRVNNSLVQITVKANELTIAQVGKLIVQGTGDDYYQTYDEFGRESRGNTRYTNKSIELLAGDYVVKLNGTEKIATVIAGQTTTLQASKLAVTGIGLSNYHLYDEFARGMLTYSSRKTNAYFEVFAGTYQVRLNNTGKTVTVQTGESVTVPSALLTFPNSNAIKYTLHDEQGDYLTYSSFYGGDRIELFAGTYILKTGGNEQQVTLTTGATTSTGGQTTEVTETETTPETETDTTTSTETYEAGIAAGIAQCKQNPSSCGLYNGTDIETAKTAGRTFCTDNPAACGISVVVETETDETEQTCTVEASSESETTEDALSATLNMQLNIDLPLLIHQPLIGDPISLWAKLKVYEETTAEGNLLFELADFGVYGEE